MGKIPFEASSLSLWQRPRVPWYPENMAAEGRQCAGFPDAGVSDAGVPVADVSDAGLFLEGMALALERLHKIMAHAGIGSRRVCEQMILEGRVSVNGEVVENLGTKADPGKDIITVDGRRIGSSEKYRYIIINKPCGVLSTVSDTHNRPTVVSLIPEIKERLYPVGRLDMDSEGLLLLTNDGALAYRIMHPSHHVPKGYIVTVEGRVDKEKADRLASGILLEDGLTAPAKVSILSSDSKRSRLQIELREGRKRQIRRMCQAIGHPVLTLKRIYIGSIKIGDLAPGEHRDLTEEEVLQLKRDVGLA